jgi:GNAT superfamily N-acetyltransferase
MSWSATRILQASADWVSPWVPPDSVHVDLGWLEFSLANRTATVKRADAGGSTGAELVRRVLAEFRSRGVTEARWPVEPKTEPEDVGRVLQDLGATVYQTVDIRAYSLSGMLPDEPPAGATALPVRSLADVASFARVSALAWGYPEPSDADIEQAFARLTAGSFVGYWTGTPAGTGGYTLAGDVARFWGAAVLPAFRGRGVYRALVRARMVDATSRGATLALVHAIDQTSSPILQRLGFQVYGQQQVLALRLDAADLAADRR